jgi:predicted DNA-binding protein (MmcQ/YjbR family)
MFALISLSNPLSANLKCEPEKAIELRASYGAIIPGFHMNKMHWNTVHFNQDAPDKLVLELIDHSYDLVFKGLTKKQQMLLTQ